LHFIFVVMKIFCIGRNYIDHAKELNNPVPKQPLVFMKPITALLKDNRPFFHPDFSENIHYEIELVIKMCRHAKYIDPKFAHKYYDALAIGIDFTARDVQAQLKQKGHPWEIAKGFDHSAPISEFLPIENFDADNIKFELHKNGEAVQIGNSKDLIFSFNELIAHISKYITLQKGDYIFTGTPAGVGPVKIGDKLEAFIEGKLMLSCEVR